MLQTDMGQRAWATIPVWPLAGLTLLLLFNLLANPSFLSVTFQDERLFGSLIDILQRGSIIAFLALGMTLVVASGGVDLSVGSVMAIAGAVAVTLVTTHEMSTATAVCAALGFSLIVGASNGILVAWVGVQPIVATLVLMVAGRGAAMLLTDGQIITVSNSSFEYLGNGTLLGLPFTVPLLTIVLVGLLLATRRTGLGLFLESLGDNETAARYCGVHTRWVKCSVYALSGLCAGIAGLVATSNIKAADSSRIGEMMELDAIFAVVVGGTSLTGGRFTLLGSLVGALIIQTLTITMYNMGIPSDVAPVPKALVVLSVCLLQSATFRERVATIFRMGRSARWS